MAEVGIWWWWHGEMSNPYPILNIFYHQTFNANQNSTVSQNLDRIWVQNLFAGKFVETAKKLRWISGTLDHPLPRPLGKIISFSSPLASNATSVFYFLFIFHFHEIRFPNAVVPLGYHCNYVIFMFRYHELYAFSTRLRMCVAQSRLDKICGSQFLMSYRNLFGLLWFFQISPVELLIDLVSDNMKLTRVIRLDKVPDP